MASEIYRIEIPIVVDDRSEEPLEQAGRRVTRFQSRLEQMALKRNEMIRKHFEKIARFRIEPVMRIRDKLTAGVLKADRLLKMLDAEKAAPVLAAQDKVSAVVLRINQLLDAMEKNKVHVLADMKGPLMDEIAEARAALVALSKVQAAPVAELRGKLYAQLTRAMTVARQLDRVRAEPEAELRERVLAKTREIMGTLRGLTSRIWPVTIKAKDQVTDVIHRITGALTSPLVMLGAGAGVTAAITYPLQLAGEMDRARNSIINYSGSLKEGQKNFQELVKYALKSPVYDVPFVAQMGGRLLAVTKDIDFTKRALDAFGNTMLYTGASLDEVKLAFRGFQQIAAKGKLQMEELYQVTENLNIPLDWVQKQLGITGDQLNNLGKLGIPAQKAMEAILKTLELHYPKANFGEDLLALASQVKETARTVVWYFGQGMKKPVIRILQDMTGIMDPTGKKFEQFTARVVEAGRRVGATLERAYAWVKGFFASLQADEEFQKLDWPGKIVFLLDMVMQKAAPVAVKVGKTIGANLGKGMVEGLAAAIRDDPVLRLAISAFIATKVPGPPLLKAGAFGVTFLSMSAYSDISKQYEKIKDEIPPGYITRPAPFSIGTPSKRVGMGDLRAVERHAYGGILTRPHLGLVAEAGPEAIIPLSARMRSRALDLWQRVGIILGAVPKLPELAGQAVINPVLDMLPRLPELTGRAVYRATVTEPSLPEIAGRYISRIKAYAHGGILTRPHLGLVAEAGPEAVIPLSSRLRSRALDLWQRTGEYLGVKPYASGGIVGPVPAVAGVGGKGDTAIHIHEGAVQATFYVSGNADLEKATEDIAERLARKIKQVFQNMPS